MLGVQLQFPLAFAIAEQIGVPLSDTVTVAPGSAPVPLIVGLGLLTVLPGAGLVIVGAVVGAMVSTVNVLDTAVLDDPLVFVATAVIVCWPSPSTVLEVQLHMPLVSAVAVQSVVPFSLTVTVVLGSAVPLIVGVESFVLPPGAGLRIVGVLTADVSTVNEIVVAELVLPAASVAVTLIV